MCAQNRSLRSAGRVGWHGGLKGTPAGLAEQDFSAPQHAGDGEPAGRAKAARLTAGGASSTPCTSRQLRASTSPMVPVPQYKSSTISVGRSSAAAAAAQQHSIAQHGTARGHNVSGSSRGASPTALLSRMATAACWRLSAPPSLAQPRQFPGPAAGAGARQGKGSSRSRCCHTCRLRHHPVQPLRLPGVGLEKGVGRDLAAAAKGAQSL